MRRPLALATLTLTGAAGLAACATIAAPPVRSAMAQQELSRWLDGRIAGQPQSCLPLYRSQDMVIVDEETLLFRDGSRRVWRTDIQGGCNGLGRPGTALLTRQAGTGSLCRGEIAQVIDTANGFTVGSCSFSDFVPYEGQGRRR